MGNLHFGIAAVMLIIWSVATIGYKAGGMIHFLLVIAAVSIVLRAIEGKNKFNITKHTNN